MVCAKMLDTAARREDCRVACKMGDGAMAVVDGVITPSFICFYSSFLL